MISELGLQGEAAQAVEDAIVIAEGSRQAASIIGLVGLLWAGLAVVGAMQAAFNAAWQVTGRGLVDRVFAVALAARRRHAVPRHRRARPRAQLAARLAGAVDIAVGARHHHRAVPLDVPHARQQHGRLAGAPAGCAPRGRRLRDPQGRRRRVRAPRSVSGSSALYGSIGVVFATLAWLAIYARLIVHGAVLNVVRYEAAAGTVTVEIEVPRIEGEVPLSREPRRGGGGAAPRLRRTSHRVGRSALLVPLPRACPVRADIRGSAAGTAADVTIDSDGPGRDDRGRRCGHGHLHQ